MKALDDQTETLHLYVIPEDQLPKKPDYPSIIMAMIAFLCILTIIGISVFSIPPKNEVSFTISVPTFHLIPVSKTVKTTVLATGKGHENATFATGIITFYNGLPTSQIIPAETRLTGADSISVVTTQQVVIPPAAQTYPPTYGHASVLAQSTIAGEIGNIRAGDINMECCITSVVAQNPYSFTGGKNERDFIYLTNQDLTNTTTPPLPTLQALTLSILSQPQLNPQCSTVTHSSPQVGRETKTASVTIIETCKAETYSVPSVVQAISTYIHRFGKGTLNHVKVFEVDAHKGMVVLYVTGRFVPITIRHLSAPK